MKNLLATAATILFFLPLFAQNNAGPLADTAYNFNFENVSPGNILPDKWKKFNRAKGYTSGTTTAEKHRGERCLSIERTGGDSSDTFGSIVNVIPAKYQGKEIEFKAYLKFQDVTDFVGILIRIDNPQETVEFKSMQSEHIHGTKDWTQYGIKAMIPPGAQKIFVAAILGGPGKLWVDDAQVLIDGQDISQAKLNRDYRKSPYGSNAAASGRVKLKTTTLYYETYGSGEPLLLLHGNSQSIYAFTYQIGDFSKKYEVIAVDTRGQGRSTDETTGPLSYDLFADDMKQLLDSLHIAKTNILGWSDGGNTGLIMALKYPEYVNKLAVMGANLFPTTEAVTDSILEQVREGIAYRKTRTDAQSKMGVRLFTMLLNEPHLTFDDMKNIKCPVLIMAGEHDMILEKHTRAIAAAIPHSKLIVFKGATHGAPVEFPAEFNAAVLSFLNQ
jgi:pimeloyl-ACP methyl ester carboxylesterase